MKFVYPAIITKTEQGYRAEFPDLCQCCAEAEDLEDVIERAKDAAYNWIELELSEELPLPPRTELCDLSVPEGAAARNLSVTIRMFEGWDE